MKVETRTISPESARDMLKRNVNNRPLRKSHVTHLARQMKDGLWHFDGMPIRLSEQGALLDGQHRLSAVIESGREQEFLIVMGIASDAFKSMDTGLNRQASDVVAIEGFDNASDVPVVIRDAMYYEVYGSIFKPRGGVKYTNAEILKYATANAKEISGSIEFAYRFKKTILPRTKVASLHYILSKVDIKAADTFIHKLMTGLDLEKDSAIYALRERLISDASSKAKLSRDSKYSLVFKCWNMWRMGKVVNERLVLPTSFPKAV
jgi:hypothetical protein